MRPQTTWRTQTGEPSTRAHGRRNPENPSITELLAGWRAGQTAAADRLLALIYPQLCAMAAARLPRDGHPWTLQPTEIAHEAYLALGRQRGAWRSESQFFKIAARIIRRVVVDHARHRHRLKRGAGARRLPLSEIRDLEAPTHGRAFHDLLADLARIEARAARVVELRVGRGLNTREVAEQLGVSPRTVARDWRFARAWLRHQLGGCRPSPPSDPSLLTTLVDRPDR